MANTKDGKNVAQEANGNCEHYNLAQHDGWEGGSFLTRDRMLVRKIDFICCRGFVFFMSLGFFIGMLHLITCV